jgi:hypothetical protein
MGTYARSDLTSLITNHCDNEDIRVVSTTISTRRSFLNGQTTSRTRRLSTPSKPALLVRMSNPFRSETRKPKSGSPAFDARLGRTRLRALPASRGGRNAGAALRLIRPTIFEARHSRAGGNPDARGLALKINWVPACAGMTTSRDDEERGRR